jgi:hypothetical protein
MGSIAAETDPTPSPAPTSDVRAASEAVERGIARTDVEGAQRADALYGIDEDAEITALADGTHPLQRDLAPEALAASKRAAAELLATGS